jgi:mono/diheme cytochrome c family protein
VARGQLRGDEHWQTGRRPREQQAAYALTLFAAAGHPLSYAVVAGIDGVHEDTFPFPVTREVLLRGQERYTIYCAVCHDRLGTGLGKVVQRGYSRPPSYYEPRVLAKPVGHYFDVMTNGWGAMPDYAGQISVRDRWAIAAYVRALQRTQVPYDRLSPEQRRRFSEEVARGGGE